MTDRTAQVLDELERLAMTAHRAYVDPETTVVLNVWCESEHNRESVKKFVESLPPQRALELIAVARAAIALMPRLDQSRATQEQMDARRAMTAALSKLGGTHAE